MDLQHLIDFVALMDSTETMDLVELMDLMNLIDLNDLAALNHSKDSMNSMSLVDLIDSFRGPDSVWSLVEHLGSSVFRIDQNPKRDSRFGPSVGLFCWALRHPPCRFEAT